MMSDLDNKRISKEILPIKLTTITTTVSMLTSTSSALGVASAWNPYWGIKPLYSLGKNHQTLSLNSMKNPSESPLPTLTDLLYEYTKEFYDYKKEAPVATQKINTKQMMPYADCDLSQQHLIAQLKKHITAKNRLPDPMLEERGYCLGLACVWLSRMAQNEGAAFKSEMMSIATLTAKEIESLPDRIDIPVERLFNLLQWTQQSGKLLKIPQINPLEKDPAFISTLSLTLTGTPSWCANLVDSSKCLELDSISLTPKNTLILLRFFDHAAAIYRNDEGLWFYDPNSKRGATIVQSRTALSEMLWKANGGGNHLTFSIDLYADQSQSTHFLPVNHLATAEHLATLMAEEMDFSGFLHAFDVNGCTALLNAAKQGHREAAKAFLDFGVDINKASNQGITPLLIAAIKNHIEIVKDLIDYGADLNKTDQDGATPLWVAAKNGHIDVVQALINAGADVHIVDNQGVSALAVAEHYGHCAVVEILQAE